MEFSRQENWSGLPFHSPGDLPITGIEPGSPALQTDSLPSELPGKPLITKIAKNYEQKHHRQLIMEIISSDRGVKNNPERKCETLKEML